MDPRLLDLYEKELRYFRESASEFAQAYPKIARRLAIELRVVESDADVATFDVGGPADLVDMFEMACSLGPLSCIVRDVERRDIGNAAFAAGDF